jgi:putative ABC transport system permease protein
MNVPAVVFVAWQGVLRRPLRSALTGLSLLVGVCAIVLVTSTGKAIRDAVQLDSILRGGHATTITVRLSPAPDPLNVAEDWKGLLERALRGVDHAIAVQLVVGETTVRVGDVVGAEIVVADPSIRSIKPFPLLQGRWLSSDHSLMPELVVNQATWERVADRAAPVEVRWSAPEQPVRARVVGVVYDAVPEPVVYARVADSPPWLIESAATVIHVHVPGSSGRELRSAVLDLAQRAGRSNEIDDVMRTDSLGEVDREVDLTRRIFLVIAALSLVVGSVGILNIGLATARERSAELLLRLSFGATRLEVMAIMVLESQLVAIAASLLALPLAVAALPAVLGVVGDRYSVDAAPTFPVEAALVGVGASCLAALVGSIAPAVRAARVTIASSTRE